MTILMWTEGGSHILQRLEVMTRGDCGSPGDACVALLTALRDHGAWHPDVISLIPLAGREVRTWVTELGFRSAE